MNFENDLEGATKDLETFLPDKHVTLEEFDNFMHRVTDVEKIVKKLASTNLAEQEEGKFLADEILKNNIEKQITDDGEIRVKTNRTMINKYSNNEDNSKVAFMRSVETDAKQRAEDRKMRNERAETYKQIGNGAFKGENYEKALTYFTKAIEFRKDSSVLWNNRALTYLKLKKYKKAISDCEWALKINDSNIKALLNLAKCYFLLNDHEKFNEYIKLAIEKNPEFTNYINDFQRELMKSEDTVKSK